MKNPSPSSAEGAEQKNEGPLEKKTAQKMASCSSSKLGHSDDENDGDSFSGRLT